MDEDKRDNEDGEIVIRLKPYWRSKTLWTAILMFLISALTVLGTFPAIANSPRLSGCVGMAFSVIMIILRVVTSTQITPTINLPAPPQAPAMMAATPPVVGTVVPPGIGTPQ